MPPKKANPRAQYFEAIKKDKLDTLRWCLRHGGISTRAADEEGHTGIQIAAAGGFVGALELLLEHVRRFGEASELEEPDEDGRTPLMMACHNGKLECVKMLVRPLLLSAPHSPLARCPARSQPCALSRPRRALAGAAGQGEDGGQERRWQDGAHVCRGAQE